MNKKKPAEATTSVTSTLFTLQVFNLSILLQSIFQHRLSVILWAAALSFDDPLVALVLLQKLGPSLRDLDLDRWLLICDVEVVMCENLTQ
jgi:hypothetical protein